MFETYSKKDEYNILMRNLMHDNELFLCFAESKILKKEQNRIKARNALKSLDLNMVKNYLMEIKTQFQLKLSGLNSEIKTQNTAVNENNYFSNERIAIFTCIFGKYDTIQEPLCVPDNCDYYIVTDLTLPTDSIWKPINLEKGQYPIDNLNSAEKNRYFKMHPHILLPNYKYSVYLDGNIKVIADPTQFINKIGDCGIAMHSHSRRICVYDEIEVCRIYRRESEQKLKIHRDMLLNEGFPKQFGMCECNVIARRHQDENVIHMMEQWWELYINYARRDQLSWPLVLYKNGISVSSVATLGNNVGKNYALRLVRHDVVQKVH